MKVKRFDTISNEWDNYNISQANLLNDIIDFAKIDEHYKPIQCIYNEKERYIDVRYMTNEDDRNIQWEWKYLIDKVDTKNWIQLLIQYANKQANKPVISFIYKEVDKIP